jgi:hypothetical protein
MYYDLHMLTKPFLHVMIYICQQSFFYMLWSTYINKAHLYVLWSTYVNKTFLTRYDLHMLTKPFLHVMIYLC